MTGSDTERYSRRHILRTAANVGIGAGLVWGVGSDYATTAERVEIEYAMVRAPGDGPSLEPRTKRVPADWHASTQTAFEVQRRLREATLPSLFASFVVPGSFDDPAPSLAVGATSESVVESVAELVGDLDVNVELDVLAEVAPKPDPPETAGDPHEVADLDRRWVPGGVHCGSPASNGTLASAAFEPRTGRRYFLTSNHVYGAEGTKVTAHRNEPLDLESGDERRTIGRVERGYPDADVVKVAPADDAVPVPVVSMDQPVSVVGQFTRIGLADMMARGEPLRKFGAYSGYSEGPIVGVDGFTCYLGDVCKSGQLKWGDKRAITDGDSGSINYAPDPDHPEGGVLVGGVNNARNWVPGVDYTWGTAGYELLEEYGLHF